MAKHKTYEGLSTLQSIHDLAARSGAVCDDPNDPLVKQRDKAQQDIADRAKAEGVQPNTYFVSKRESKLIQTIHDATRKGGGAKCNSVSSGFSASGGERNIMIDFNRTTLATFASMGDRIDLRKFDQGSLLKLLEATEQLAAEVVSFNSGGAITETNRYRIMADAETSAAAFASARNARTIPKSRVGETWREKEIRKGVEDWLKRKRKAVH
jgi:hypothetical protein